MNINKKIIFIIFSFLLLSTPIYAEDKIDIVDEELPAINPFLGGGSAGSPGGDGLGPDGVSKSNNSVSLKNMKLELKHF